MKATLLIHVERTDDDVVWWAESAELPGFSAAADSLADLRAAIHEAMAAEGGDGVELIEKLVGEEQPRLEPGERLTTALVTA